MLSSKALDRIGGAMTDTKMLEAKAFRAGMLRAAEIMESRAGPKPQGPVPPPYKLGLHRAFLKGAAAIRKTRAVVSLPRS